MKRTKQERIRLTILCSIAILFFITAIGRLFQIQIIRGGEFSEIVQRQSSGRVPLPAARGTIYDRYGRLVARDVIGSALCAYPRNEKELARVSLYLEKLFGLKPRTAKRKYGLKVRQFRYIDRRISDELALRIEREAPSGLHLRQHSRREYPFGLVGKQVLGFTDIDNKGRSGLELGFDSALAGQNGWADFRRDGLRNAFRLDKSAAIKPVAGESLVLTLDWRLQEIVESELKAALKKYNAKQGAAVFVESETGDILAIAHFNPEEKNRNLPVKCCAVTDQFEPGSIVKAFTAAGLLDAGIIDYSDSVFCEDGVWKVGRQRLHDDKKHGWMSFREVMELSSNIGIGKYAVELGGDELLATFKRFGLGERTNCGLPGESAGTLRSLRWSDYNIAALAMGHSVAVTPVQLANGFGAIANGGTLMKSNLLLGNVDENGYVHKTRSPEMIRKVIKKSSLDSLRSFLRGVVVRGTAQEVNSPAVAIAGKTGTAEIPDLKNKRYFKNKFNASFGGFFPYEDPVIAGVVILTDPKPITYGGHTSGPAFRRIAERYLSANPDLFSVPERTLFAKSKPIDAAVETPDLIGRDIKVAKQIAQGKGLVLHSTATEGTVQWQYPPSDRLLLKGDKLIVEVSAGSGGKRKMDDLRGLTMRQASALLYRQGIKVVINGNGKVFRQSIRPGTTIGEGDICRIECKPMRGKRS